MLIYDLIYINLNVITFIIISVYVDAWVWHSFHCLVKFVSILIIKIKLKMVLITNLIACEFHPNILSVWKPVVNLNSSGLHYYHFYIKINLLTLKEKSKDKCDII